MQNITIKRDGVIVEHCRDSQMYVVPFVEPPEIDLKSCMWRRYDNREPIYMLICPGCNYSEGPFTPGNEVFVFNGVDWTLAKDERGDWWWKENSGSGG